MSLTSKDVADITRLLDESSFDELYLEVNGFKLTLKRGTGAAAARGESTAPTPAAQGAAAGSSATAASVAAPASSGAAPSAAPAAAADPDVQGVVAPLLGTFYRAPKPGEPPFVELGSAVEEDTIIGIIEVMKLMNTVRAGVRGTVCEILGRDGALVEYGEPLIRVRTTA